MSISGDLISDVRQAFFQGLEFTLTGKGVRHGLNGYAPHAFSAYVTSVASVEAYVNETFLGSMCRSIYPNSAVWDLNQESLERMDLLMKISIVTQMLFGATPPRNAQPFQDFSLLSKVRNEIVHFKMQFAVPKFVQTLSAKGVALTTSEPANYPWPARLSCTEGIRWAHNTACRMATALTELIPTGERDHVAMTADGFQVIEEAEVRAWYAQRGRLDA
jgi:hypothetical protein